MKTAETVKERDFERQFDALLQELLGRVPFLKVASINKDARVSGSPARWADRVAQVKAGDRKWTLVVEEKRVAQPREVRSAVLQLEQHLKHLRGDAPRYGVLLAPFISEESAKICEEAGIGYADLAGNARLAFDQVYIERRSAENPFRERRETRSLFAPRATRALRFLLQGPLRAWKVTELAKSAQVSLGWVSAVRQQLLAREWAEEEPGGVRVKKPSEVLDAWAKADDWEKRTTTREYSLLLSSEPQYLAEKLLEVLKEESPVFTGLFAGALRHRYTAAPVVTAYVKKFPERGAVEEKLLGREVSGGGVLRLVLPKDPGVLYPGQTARGFPLVSDVQIYLDLLRGGERGEEQAAELRRWPDFAGGWT
jgi:hypothetical protein